MWKNSPLRLLGALLALVLIATACGSTAATDTAAQSEAAEESDDSHDGDPDHDGDHGDDDKHDDDGHDGDSAGDSHGSAMLDVNPDAPTPDVAIELTETDTAGMFDIAVTLTNFTITPQNIDGDPIDNEGHMHLLIDGEKVERFTDLEHQVMVPAGDHLVEVELNANNHSAYAIDGTPIRAGVTVTGHGEPAVDDGGHDHGDHSASADAVEDGLAMSEAAVNIVATLASGEITIEGDDRVEANVGDVVAIMITSDVAEQAHLHGYDILVDVDADGDAAMILFTADTAGKFELEFEKSGAFIAELVIS